MKIAVQNFKKVTRGEVRLSACVRLPFHQESLRLALGRVGSGCQTQEKTEAFVCMTEVCNSFTVLTDESADYGYWIVEFPSVNS